MPNPALPGEDPATLLLGEESALLAEIGATDRQYAQLETVLAKIDKQIYDLETMAAANILMARKSRRHLAQLTGQQDTEEERSEIEKLALGEGLEIE